MENLASDFAEESLTEEIIEELLRRINECSSEEEARLAITDYEDELRIEPKVLLSQYHGHVRH